MLGSEVGDLRKVARLKAKYTEDVLRQISFRFLSDTDKMFALNEMTGVIRVAMEIDRDSASLCRQKEVCEVLLDVITQPAQHFQIIKVYKTLFLI